MRGTVPGTALIVEHTKWSCCFLKDWSKYFDTLNYTILLNLLRKEIKDERVIQIVKRVSEKRSDGKRSGY